MSKCRCSSASLESSHRGDTLTGSIRFESSNIAALDGIR